VACDDNPVNAGEIISAIRDGELPTSDLVKIAHAVALRGKNNTSILGQFGEELVANAYDGTIESFDQKGYDVLTRAGERIQVKTYTKGKKPGAIRSFEYDVIVLEIDPETADVVSARRYAAEDVFVAFARLHANKYAARFFWGGNQSDRYERGWRIQACVASVDVTSDF
jgi:hypothetical protein